MSTLVLATLMLAGPALAEPPAEYVPAPPSEIPGYSETVFPCGETLGWKRTDGSFISVEEAKGRRDFDARDMEPAPYLNCTGEPHLQAKTLRELALLRNTIYARYGWGGFRKAWLREHFQKQPWYKPDPGFSYKRLSKVDRQNVELIAKAELSFRYVDLERKRDEMLATAGKWWGDLPSYNDDRGVEIHACDYTGSITTPSGTPRYSVTEFLKEVPFSKDCTYHQPDRAEARKHRANKPIAPNLDKLGAEDRIELGLISRAMGDFAIDEAQRQQATESLDSVLKVKELRQLSLRDLRLLRNTIYARRGRPFKSELLQEHFARMPWYKPDPDYTDQRLTKTDKRNIDLIVQVEKEFGGALMDKDFRVTNPSEAGDVDEYVPTAMWA